MLSYTKKRMAVTFKLGQGAFGREGFDTVKLEGLRMSAIVIKAGGASLGELQLRVWGLTLDQMNKLSTLGMLAVAIRNNQVLLEAGDTDSGMSVVFSGTITNGWADMSGMPDVSFHVTGHAGMVEAMTPVPPISFRGGTDAALIMAGLATTMGLAFENSGVSVFLSNPYFPGTAREQARRCAEAGGFEWIIDSGVLAIWPRNGYRGEQIPLIGPKSGLIGYPSYTSNGISITTLFNPNIAFGTRFKLETSFEPAAGIWIVSTLMYRLEAEMPGGDWLMRIDANPPGFAPVGLGQSAP